MTTLQFPIKDEYRYTQRYGQNLLNYQQFGMKGHNGIDLACPRRTKIYASHDGVITQAVDGALPDAGGYGNQVKLRGKLDKGFVETVYAHFLFLEVKLNDKVKAGDLLGFADSTGFSTGDHLHFGVRFRDDNNKVIDYDNGYFGYVDPDPLFEKEPPTTVYPVDLRYGQPKNERREKRWERKFDIELVKRQALAKGYSHYEWPKMKNAFVYGYWDKETVFEPANFTLWANFTKPQYNKEIKGRPLRERLVAKIVNTISPL